MASRLIKALITRSAPLALSTLLLLPPGAEAQQGRYPQVELGGRAQVQYAHSSIDGAENDFFARRVRLRADVAVNDWISGRVQPDFAGGGAALQDAYVELAFSEGLRLTIGQFKRPFDLFDLASSTNLSIIERDGRIEGLDVCPGVGRVCTHNRLLEGLLFAGRDQGVMLEGEAGRIGYSAMVSNGEGANTSDVNDAKSFSSRVSVAASEDLTIAGKLAVHDYLESPTETSQAMAFGVDAEWGTWRDGLHAQVTLVSGENWRSLDGLGDPATFHAFEGWASFYQPLDGARVVGVEPLLRIGYADGNTDGVDDAGVIFTPGLMFYFGGRNKFGANVDVYSPETGGSEYSLKVQTYLYF